MRGHQLPQMCTASALPAFDLVRSCSHLVDREISLLKLNGVKTESGICSEEANGLQGLPREHRLGTNALKKAAEVSKVRRTGGLIYHNCSSL